jgi:N-acetylneuraminic acid mutarotase
VRRHTARSCGARAARALVLLLFGLVVLLLPTTALGATVLYRVNAGGPTLASTPDWSADTAATPSPYGNSSLTGNYLFATTTAIDLTHPSVPAGTPASLFQTERYDVPGGAQMEWKFPVSAGSHEVRLYFAEIYPGTQSVGARVFDVFIEGSLALDNYDVFADAGGYRGVVKSFVVTSDSSLDIRFAHAVENPAIKAIEILDAGHEPPPASPNTLAAVPTSVDFGSVAVGTTKSATIQLTNAGAAGDPSIVVDATSVTGLNASEFGDSFNDATNITLAPGASTPVSVTFAPKATGSRAATLEVSHSGTNTPLSVALNGSGAQSAPPGSWKTLAPSGINRQEVSYVYAGGKFYLAGGGVAHQAYDPATNTWSSVAPLPVSADHIQGVEVGGKIYYIGGLTGWPGPHIDTVYIYDPKTNSFTQGAKMPRGRGAGGVAVHQGKIYYAGGLASGVAVPWFDVYDPVANTWKQLPDMPTARDHFHAAVVNGKFYAIGGRNKDINATTTVNQAYDLATGSWQTGLAPLPTARGGFAAAALGDEILIIGGEGGSKTFATVEAYNTSMNTWRTLASMPTPRHGIQAAVCNGGVYVAAGGKIQGGGSPSDVHEVFFLGSQTACAAAPVGFGKSALKGTTLTNPTSLQFGPDERLYVAQQNGLIRAYKIVRNGPNDYAVTATETISSIQSIPNHNDDGSLNTSVKTRQVTGLLVTGTAAKPVIYVGSSDPRIGAGPEGNDLNLDTNSSMLSRLTWNGTGWDRVDLVRGLPRSEENHSINGMQLDPATNVLYVALGGNTNEGAPSNNFALLPEYALSAAVLSIDLNAIGNTTYDLPTLDDENRAGSPDANDPFGGNDGKNQAKLVPGGPVQVHAPGFRNAYDVLITKSGRMYTIDNGGNAGWGAPPKNEGPQGTCTNELSEPGETEPDTLHLVTGPGYYGGHPNPTRGNKANTFNANNQSPVATANAIECDYRAPSARGALTSWPFSTNGLAEYTASNFGQAMKGDLIATSFDNKVYRVKLNASGDQVVTNQALFTSVGSNAWSPLDVIGQGDAGPFPGTIWVADHAAGVIHTFEPNDYASAPSTCAGSDDPTLDEDNDGYSNADEIDNGTNPCSAADLPSDWDNDDLSNLNDPDDDNDGISDSSDRFAIDSANGTTTSLPVQYSWNNDAPKPGGLLNLGFTGLMTNGVANYETLFDAANMTAGGAAGVTTVDRVPDGDAQATANTQKYGFQFGFKPLQSGQFTVRTRILAPFAGLTPQDSQSMGVFLGTGDQNNYAKIVTSANGGAGGVEFLKEVNGSVVKRPAASVTLPGPDWVDLFLTVDVGAGTVQPSYVVATNGVAGPRTMLGGPEPLPSSWLSGTQAVAAGLISTSAGSAPEFPASWDFIEAVPGDGTTTVVAEDTFTRSGANGWGTANVGGAWSVVAGSASSFAVDGQKGTVATPTGGVQQRAELASTSIRDVDVRSKLVFPGLPSGDSVFSYLTLRDQPGGAHYRVGLYLTPAGKIFVRGQTHAGTALFADVDTGLSLVAGDVFVLRVQVEGSNPTVIRAKAWKQGTSEPVGWAASATDSTTGLQVPGALGIRTINLSSGGMTLGFDDFLATGLFGGADTTPPTVTTVSPQSGASGVPTAANVTATFSEALDPATVTPSTFTLLKQGTSTPLSASISYDGSTRTATLDPSSNLEAGTTYVATVKGGSTGVKDLSGNALAQNLVWSFTTQASAAVISLTVKGYKVKGLQKADLSWTGAGSTTVDVYRNGVKVATTANDGFHTDPIDKKGGATYVYKVCEAGTSICSNEVTVIF